MPRKTVFLYAALAALTALAPREAPADEMVRPDKSKIRLTVAPGQTATGFITVENPSAQPKSVRAYLEDWTYLAPYDGSKEFRPAGSIKNSAADWITFTPAELTLAPNSRERINYSVKVPAGADAGHYAVLFMESAASSSGEEGVGVNLAIRVAVLFFVEPEGMMKRTLTVDGLPASRSPEGILKIEAPVTNTGNIDLTVGGSFDIMDAKGMVAARGVLSEVYTLPGNSARMAGSWSLPIAPGEYSLILTLDIGKALEEANAGRGPVIVKEAALRVGTNGRIEEVGELR